MRVAALEAVGDHVMACAAGKDLDEQAVALREDRSPLLHAEPVLDRAWQCRPVGILLKQQANPVGKIGGQRQAAAGIGRHPGRVALAGRDLDDGLSPGLRIATAVRKRGKCRQGAGPERNILRSLPEPGPGACAPSSLPLRRWFRHSCDRHGRPAYRRPRAGRPRSSSAA